jgi:hypothetical protein
MRRTVVPLLAVAMLAVACGRQAEPTSTTEPPASTTSTIAPATTTTTTPVMPSGLRPRLVEAFAAFEGVPLIVDSPPYAGPPTPTSVEGVFIAPSRLNELDEAAIATLEQQGFVVVPGNLHRLLYPMYQTHAYEGEVYFVTTDAAYHHLHLAFSKLLRDLEQEELLPILEGLLTGLVDEARAQRDELAGTTLEDFADRAVQLYEAAAVLAGLDVGPIGPLAAEEVALAEEAIGLTRSPTTGLCPGDPEASMECLVDYSLFRPRGHYTRNADLERYFRAMSLLGNENFSVGYGDTMLLAALVARPLSERPDLVEAWTLVYEPTAFLVGMADDYTPFELGTALDPLVPGWRDDPTLLDEDVAAEAGRALLALRSVGIDEDAASVRIMGVRFVVDSYVYDQLRFPFVGDPPFGRRYATPLDLVATFGSELAYRIMDEEGYLTGEWADVGLTDPETGEHWTNYDDQLAMLTGMLSARAPGDWAATVYDAWLYAFEPVWTRHGAAYPDFMRTEAWERKGLQTGLGSYTELKHDTVLYAKQSFAAEGDFQPVEYPEPRHWVEPNPVAFARMRAVVGLLDAGLSARGLLPEESANAGLLDALDSFLGRLERLAYDELAGRPISDADNEWLGTVGSTMEALWIRSADPLEEIGEGFPNQDLDSALVVDVMRTTYHILEIGTGRFDSLYVLVPDDDGRFQVARGGVYSYYEFWRGAEEGRLTDEEWRTILDTAPPERPPWQTTLFPSG